MFDLDICSICLINDSDIILECRHKFCKECISKWYKKSSTCPLDRSFITSEYYDKKILKSNNNCLMKIFRPCHKKNNV